MNIFVVDSDPCKAAQMLCDQHVVKMPTETAQMLSAALPENIAPYKRTHYNHPCSIWARATEANWEWTIKHGLGLCEEYTRRYKKHHKARLAIETCAGLLDVLFFDSRGLLPFVQCIPDQYKRNNPVEAYRDYYKAEKMSFARYRYSERPQWTY